MLRVVVLAEVGTGGKNGYWRKVLANIEVVEMEMCTAQSETTSEVAWRSEGTKKFPQQLMIVNGNRNCLGFRKGVSKEKFWSFYCSSSDTR